MKYGYARVSSKDQNLETQVEQLKAVGCHEIIEEKISGISKEKKLDVLIEQMLPGDTLVATRMDRLGRNALQLIELVEGLESQGVGLVILDMNIDTKSLTGKFFLQIMAAFSELERGSLKEKQRRGIELAMARGTTFGSKPNFTRGGLETALKMYEEGDRTVKEITEITGVSKATLYRKLKKMKAQV